MRMFGVFVFLAFAFSGFGVFEFLFQVSLFFALAACNFADF